MPTTTRPTALLLQLEFPTWTTARPWTYSANFAVEEGLTTSGFDCLTIPVIADLSCASPHSWIAHARRFIGNKTFDQVWVWLVHTPLDSGTLEWITGLAPIRVGILMESLRYDADDYRWAPHLQQRHALVEQQMRFMTHVLAPDELDAEELQQRSQLHAVWWPPMVPERFISLPHSVPLEKQAVFHGTPYGPRQHWVSHPTLVSRLHYAKAVSPPTPYQQLFDQLQEIGFKILKQSNAVTASVMHEYVDSLRSIREKEFAEWMGGLSRWPAIVNLPSLAKFYGGRVFEGIAAGRPIISWKVPRHPKNLTLFQDGLDLLLFDPNDPETLARQIERVLDDPAAAAELARNAQQKLRTYHTAERRLAQTLRWLHTGAPPDYGETKSSSSTDDQSATKGTVHSIAYQPGCPTYTTPRTSTETDDRKQESIFRRPSNSKVISPDPRRNPLRILFLMPDNAPWSEAKGWCYFNNFGVVEGLEATGAQCTVIPVRDSIPDFAPSSWLRHIRNLCSGHTFDQVWFWVHYCQYSPSFLEWLKTVAPVRVGLLTESMALTREERQASRPGILTMFKKQLPCVTHLLVGDERDEAMLNARSWARALWWPTAVPSRWVMAPGDLAPNHAAVFYGYPHARRIRYFADPELAALLTRPSGALEDFTDLPHLFNELMLGMDKRLASGFTPNREVLEQYVAQYRKLRERLHAHWLDNLRQWSVHVSLPSVFQSYSGRVYEAMAAGRPIISTHYSHQTRNHALFTHGENILLCENEPSAVAQSIRQLLKSPDMGQRIAECASRTIVDHHTAELRAHQVLRWIATGQEPRYGIDTMEEYEGRFERTLSPISGARELAAERVRSVPLPNTRGVTARDEERDMADATSALNALKQHDLAQAELILQANPCPSWRGWMLQGCLAQIRKDQLLAIELFEASLRNGGGLQAVVKLAETEAALGRLDRAWDWYEEALLADPGCKIALDQAVALAAPLNRLNQLPRILEEFIAKHPNDFSARLLLATIYWKSGNPDAAGKEYQVLEQMSPGHKALHFLRDSLVRTMPLV